MKNFNFLFCLIIPAIILSSCKKKNNEPPTGSTPVSFVGTQYTTLGTFNDSGRPNYLVAPDVISPGLISFINGTLPESTDQRKSHPELLTGNGNYDIKITTKSDVWLTFVSEGTGYTNSIGYYTYPSGTPPLSAADIKNVFYVFPNASIKNGDGDLDSGDKVKLGSFEAGTSIGFVLLQHGWDRYNKKLISGVVHFVSNENLNPENNPALKRHALLINYSPENKIVLGFEDIDRSSGTCDHDFNDVVLYATVTSTN